MDTRDKIQLRAEYDQFVSQFTKCNSNLSNVIWRKLFEMAVRSENLSVTQLFEGYLMNLVCLRRPWIFTGFSTHEQLSREDFTSDSAYAEYKNEWEDKDELCGRFRDSLRREEHKCQTLSQALLVFMLASVIMSIMTLIK